MRVCKKNLAILLCSACPRSLYRNLKSLVGTGTLESSDMLPEPSPEVLSALQLFRRGRFFETVATLEHFSEGVTSPRKKDFLALALLS